MMSCVENAAIFYSIKALSKYFASVSCVMNYINNESGYEKIFEKSMNES